MIKEMVKEVEEAERNADKIMQRADDEADAIIAEAVKNAALLKKREKEAAQARAAQALEDAKTEMEEVEALSNQETQKEVAAFRQSASQKEEQAIKAVIASLY